MPVLRNISPYGGLDIPLVNQFVDRGAEFTVSDEHARILLDQETNYEPVDDAAKAIREPARRARKTPAKHPTDGDGE